MRESLMRVALGIGLMTALVITTSGCLIPGSVSGGGWIPSADGVSGDKANFGFSGQQCDLSQPPTGNFNFHDKTSSFSAPNSVKLNGTLADAGLCAVTACTSDSDCTQASNGYCVSITNVGSFCEYVGTLPLSDACEFCLQEFGSASGLPPKTYGLDVNYKSTNSNYPGTGAAEVCVIDKGQGSKAASKDQMAISVNDGPYAGYTNQGSVQGNVSGQTCP